MIAPSLFQSALDATWEKIGRAGWVPGGGSVIVCHGSVIACRLFGYQDPMSKTEVTADTLIPFGSISKSINGALTAKLAQTGLVKWDSPIRKLGSRLDSLGSVGSDLVTLRDMVTMRAGLPRHGWMWLDREIERSDLVRRLALLDSSAPLRQSFQYSNLSVTAAGHVVEELTGARWEDLATEQVLKPYGLHGCTFWPVGRWSLAIGMCEDRDRRLVPHAIKGSGSTAPSGGSLHGRLVDMAAWMICNIEAGASKKSHDGDVLCEIQHPQVCVDRPAGLGQCYALGWFVDRVGREKRVAHGGFISGVSTDISLFPESDFGIASYSTFGLKLSAKSINESIFDHLVGDSGGQPLKAAIAAYEDQVTKAISARAGAIRRAGTTSSHAPAAYVGVYSHPAYGEIEVSLDGGRLVAQRDRLTLALNHWHFDAWVGVDPPNHPVSMTHPWDESSPLLFRNDVNGNIDDLLIALEPAVAPIKFVLCR